jgi:hypothetical protein
VNCADWASGAPTIAMTTISMYIGEKHLRPNRAFDNSMISDHFL